MSRRSRFFLVVASTIALTAVACSTSADIAEPAEPAAETAEPTPTAAPTPTPEPTPTAAPTPTPEPTPTPDPGAVWNGVLDEATAALLSPSADIEIIELLGSTVLGTDLSLRREVRIDGDGGRSQLLTSFVGEGWADIVDELNAEQAAAGEEPGNDLSQMTLEHIFTAEGSVFFSASVDGEPADEWFAFSDFALARASFEQSGQAALIRPEDTLYVLAGLLDIGSEPEQLDDDRWRTTVDHTSLFDYLPGSTWNGLVEFGIEAAMFSGSSTTELGFVDNRLTTATIDFTRLIDEAVQLGAPLEMRLLEVIVNFEIGYDNDFSFELPPADLVVDELVVDEPLPSLFATGECYTAKEIERVRPIASSCDASHVVEVYADGLFDQQLGAPFPGVDELWLEASERCAPSFEARTGVHQDITALNVQVLSPDEMSWRTGDRSWICFIWFDSEVDVPLEGVDPRRTDSVVSSYFAAPGDCLTDRDLNAAVFQLISCDDNHMFEVFHEHLISGDTYPGDDAIADLAAEVCPSQFETFVGRPYEKSEWYLEWLFPFEYSWDVYGDRVLTCLITAYEPVSGSAAGTNR